MRYGCAEQKHSAQRTRRLWRLSYVHKADLDLTAYSGVKHATIRYLGRCEGREEGRADGMKGRRDTAGFSTRPHTFQLSVAPTGRARCRGSVGGPSPKASCDL